MRLCQSDGKNSGSVTAAIAVNIRKEIGNLSNNGNLEDLWLQLEYAIRLAYATQIGKKA